MSGLAARARALRARVLRMAHRGRTAHVASALSSVDILVALYFGGILRGGARVDDPLRDRCILSKGHGCMALYAALAEAGVLPEEALAGYATDGGALAEHPSPTTPGIEAATGSLGHGLAIGAGLALAAQLDGAPWRAFVLLSDGECNEGSVWESAMFAAGRRLEGLVAIVDYNGLQAMGRSDEVTGLAPLADKWAAFGFGVRELPGHDPDQLVAALSDLPFVAGRPSALVLRTIKGKGVSFMEDDLEWHYRPPSDDDLARALAEVEGR